MARPRDFQRSKLYAWEVATLRSKDNDELTMSECIALAEQVWKHAGTGATLTFCDGRRRRSGNCKATPYGFHIALPRYARRRWYVIHEVAHAVAPYGARHREEFCRTYAKLLEAFGGWTGVLTSMRAWGLKTN